MPDIIFLLFISISAISGLILVAISTAQYITRKNSIEKQAFQELEKIHQQGSLLLDEATKQAESIVSRAQSQEEELINGVAGVTEKFEKAAEQEFMQNAKSAESLLNKQLDNYNSEISKVHQEYVNYLNQLKSHLTVAQEDTLQIVKEQSNNFFEKFEQNLADFLSDTEQKTIYSIELELKSARQLIDSYKQQQLKLVDENVIAILERTLSLVLTKKLSLKDHVDLVYESLEKAKVEKFIV